MKGSHLSSVEAQRHLDMGQPIEQWLSSRPDGDDRLIKWLRIHKERDGGYCATNFDVYDQGNEAFIDVYEFQSYIPDEPYGISKSFQDWESAFDYALTELGADPEKFVGDGGIQGEYVDFIRREGVLPANLPQE